MKELKVDIDELVDIMENNSADYDHFHYLDQETGEILFVMADVQNLVDENVQEGIDGLPEWQKDQVEDAKRISSDEEGRYLHIPRIESHDAYRFMDDFANDVESDELREKLQIALDGQGAFRLFKNVLYEYPAEQAKWFRYHNERVKREVIDWLLSNSIKPK
ncbi:MAG: hypothetical protein KDD50_02280 [Bdellovibrionales bacterium]|nr:hypothetical protein [Bdellovibrionales bacterium]MCB0413132.1 hypothetical protein [Bdellovibrionales bacterium]